MKASIKCTSILGAAATAALLALSSCGGDGSGADDAGADPDDGDGGRDSNSGADGESDADTETDSIGLPFVASCGDQVNAGTGYEYIVCQEYYFEANDTLEQESLTTCSIAGGTWSGEKCPTAGLNGSCTTVGDSTVVRYYYGLPETDIPARQSTCEQLGNIWKAP